MTTGSINETFLGNVQKIDSPSAKPFETVRYVKLGMSYLRAMKPLLNCSEIQFPSPILLRYFKFRLRELTSKFPKESVAGLRETHHWDTESP